MAANDNTPPGVQAFAFGDPEPVLDRRDLLDHIECWKNGKWYEPPVDKNGLARTFRSAAHHESALRLKVQLLSAAFIPHRMLSRQTFEGFVLDYLVLGNGYLERRENLVNQPMRLERSVGRYTRRGEDLETYYFLTHGALGGLYGEHQFKKGAVFHMREADLNQEVYGVPGYLGALQSAFLNEAATIFRRRYFVNGSHAGFILYMTDAAQKAEDIDGLREALKKAKGPGNFRNLFVYAPGGSKDGIQLIPVSEVAAKDEFTPIKNISRDDILAAHRVPPQLLGLVPANAGGFGDVAKAANVFHKLEIVPLQQKFREVNDWIGQEVVRFAEREDLPEGGAKAAA